MKKVSIIVPMYNESQMADLFFETLNSYLDNITRQKEHIGFEIIAVNDGSQDDTLEKLKIWNKKCNNIAVVSLSRNFGQEPAVFTGLEKASGDAVIVMDCDLQDPPEMIAKMIDKWEQGFEVVNIRRVSRISDTKFKRDTAGMYYNLLNRISYKVKFPHNVNNFRLIDRRVLDVILKMPEKNKFYRGLVPFTGFKSYELDIERKKRRMGESKYNLKAMVRLAIDGITSTTVKPLYWAVTTSLFFIIFSSIVTLALTLLYINGVNINYTLFGVLSGLCFFSGVILGFLGVIGIYTGKMYEEIKGRPYSIIDLYIPFNNKD